MSSEGPQTKQEQVPHPIEVPTSVSRAFIDGTLEQQGQLISEDVNSKLWREFEQAVEVPNVGKALLRVDYRQANYPDETPPERFDQVRFDYVEACKDEHPRIAEMHWYIEKGESNNPYPFDLMQVHRYVEPEYRDRKGVGRSLYTQSEAWAQQVADAKGEDVVLALSTDQPSTMKWAAALGYVPYPEETERYEEVIAHPELFEYIDETDSAGQVRSTAIERDGKRVRIWFTKTLSPKNSNS